MNTRVWVLAFALIALVFVSGCVEDSSDDSGVYAPPADTEVESELEPEPETEAECEVKDDCDDDNFCTTDNCNDGTCVNLLASGCAVEESGYIAITGVNYDDADEWMDLNAKNMDVRGWTIETNGTEMFKFGNNYFNLNGQLRINTGMGLGNSINVYMGRTEGMWTEGLPISIVDDNGNTVLVYE
ncbi:MAG: hypothetical protein ABIG20_04095 [archaeon]